MYFTKGRSSIYHILHYLGSGSAPPPCGAQAERRDMQLLRAGRTTPNIVGALPTGGVLCKHCQAAERKRISVAEA